MLILNSKIVVKEFKISPLITQSNTYLEILTNSYIK
jgi:hypothetical protein